MDDDTLRILLWGGVIAAVGVFREPIKRFLRKIGYTGWK